jgi:hypothetical protein
MYEQEKKYDCVFNFIMECFNAIDFFEDLILDFNKNKNKINHDVLKDISNVEDFLYKYNGIKIY